MPTVTIRDATVADARGIAEVHVAAWRWAYRDLMPDAVLDALSIDEREAMWREGLSDPKPGWGCLVADERGDIVGFVGYGPPLEPVEPVGTGEVYAIYLDPAAVGTGIGRALFAEGTRRLREAGFDRAFLWVLETNERARRFYERAGWSWDGTTSEHRFDRAELPIVRYTAELSGFNVRCEASRFEMLTISNKDGKHHVWPPSNPRGSRPLASVRRCRPWRNSSGPQASRSSSSSSAVRRSSPSG